MNNNRRQQQPSNRQSGSGRKGQGHDEKRYYPLTIMGFGYVNYLEERESERGSFTTFRLNALVGDADQSPKQYRSFSVAVTKEELQDILWDFEQDIIDERNVFIQFSLHDAKATAYEKDDGTLSASINSYLAGIDKLWIDGELMYEAPVPDTVNQQSQQPARNSQRSRGNADNAQSNYPQTRRQGNAPANNGSRQSRGSNNSNANRNGRSSSSQRAYQN